MHVAGAILYRPKGGELVMSLAGKVTAGLAESNGRLPLGSYDYVTSS